MDDREAYWKAMGEWVNAIIKFIDNNINNKKKGKKMKDREAFFIAIYELLDRAIYALKDEPNTPLALSRIEAAKTLVANELRFIKKMAEEAKNEDKD